MKCMICKRKFQGYGHNADPLAEGLCCDKCNLKVMYARVMKGRGDQ